MSDAQLDPLAVPAERGAAPVALPVERASVAADVALIATFAAFIAVCAVLPAIPVAGMAVPITLQTFGVMLAGLVLGPRRGALAVLLYLAVGLAGLPVFAQGTGGLAVLGKPSAGYLLAFPLAALLAGLLVAPARRLLGGSAATWAANRVPALAGRERPLRSTLGYLAVFGSAAAASLLLVHPIGIAVMGWRLDMSAGEAIAAGATFLPGDVIKNLLAALVATAVFRAFPDLLRHRR